LDICYHWHIFDEHEFQEEINLNKASHALKNPLPYTRTNEDLSVCSEKGSEFVSSGIIISTPYTSRSISPELTLVSEITLLRYL
jgi:hypothetical protein